MSQSTQNHYASVQRGQYQPTVPTAQKVPFSIAKTLTRCIAPQVLVWRGSKCWRSMVWRALVDSRRVARPPIAAEPEHFLRRYWKFRPGGLANCCSAVRGIVTSGRGDLLRELVSQHLADERESLHYLAGRINRNDLLGMFREQH